MYKIWVYIPMSALFIDMTFNLCQKCYCKSWSVKGDTNYVNSKALWSHFVFLAWKILSFCFIVCLFVVAVVVMSQFSVSMSLEINVFPLLFCWSFQQKDGDILKAYSSFFLFSAESVFFPPWETLMRTYGLKPELESFMISHKLITPPHRGNYSDWANHIYTLHEISWQETLSLQGARQKEVNFAEIISLQNLWC